MYQTFYCNQPPHAEVTKLLCPHHEGTNTAGGTETRTDPVKLVPTVPTDSDTAQLRTMAAAAAGIHGPARSRLQG